MKSGGFNCLLILEQSLCLSKDYEQAELPTQQLCFPSFPSNTTNNTLSNHLHSLHTLCAM